MIWRWISQELQARNCALCLMETSILIYHNTGVGSGSGFVIVMELVTT
jgi:hypothetical protein